MTHLADKREMSLPRQCYFLSKPFLHGAANRGLNIAFAGALMRKKKSKSKSALGVLTTPEVQHGTFSLTANLQRPRAK